MRTIYIPTSESGTQILSDMALCEYCLTPRNIEAVVADAELEYKIDIGEWAFIAITTGEFACRVCRDPIPVTSAATLHEVIAALISRTDGNLALPVFIHDDGEIYPVTLDDIDTSMTDRVDINLIKRAK